MRLEWKHSNWEKKEIGSDLMVIPIGQYDPALTKQSTLEQALGSLFTKYEVKKDSKGSYIKIPETNLLSDLTNTYKVNPTEFASKTKEQETNAPDFDEKGVAKKDANGNMIMKKQNVRMGNTEHFAWYYTKENNVDTVVIQDFRKSK